MSSPPNKIVSPDKTKEVLFFDFDEIRMGAFESKFKIFNTEKNTTVEFEPFRVLSSHPHYAVWDDNSNYLALAARYVRYGYGYLIIQFPEVRIAFIKFVNPYPVEIYFAGDTLIVSYQDEQVRLSNSRMLFGGGVSEVPKKKYLKPQDLSYEVGKLSFYPHEELNNIESLTKLDTEYKLDLINDGFFEFSGKYPQSTTDVYNVKPLQVIHLAAFAEYGDRKSQEWLEEIKQKTGNKYSAWTKVSDYLGYRER